MFQVQNIKWLDFEISSTCNARCIDCCRVLYQDDMIVHNTLHNHLNQLYDYALFQSHVSQFSNLESISFCGNSGDAMAHPKIAEISQWLLQTFNKIKIDIETNGSLGKQETWELLAQLGITVSFSIDGLEDTNHIYRQNVPWKNIIKNVKTFISNGGKAIWQTIDFPHISHQINEMETLSKNLGFEKFVVRPRFSPNEDHLIQKFYNQPIGYIDANKIHFEKSPIQHNWLEKNKIQPFCKKSNSQSLYIDCDSTVWPCCTFAQIRYRDNYEITNKYHMLVKKYGNNWNNLKHYSLKKILDSEFYQNELENSWSNIDTIYKTCIESCGVCR